MFSYRCPACGKQHKGGSPSFEKPFQAQCLRCRQTFAVTRDLVSSPAGGELVTAAAPPHPASTAITTDESALPGAPVEVEAIMVEEDPDADDGEEEPAPARPKPARNKPTPKEPASPPSGGKRWLIIGGLLGLLILAGVGGYFLFAGKSKPTRPVAKGKRPASSKNEKKTVKDGAKKSEKDKPAKKPEKDKPAGLEPKNKEPIRLAAAQMSAGLAGEPAAINRVFDTALLEVTGLFDRLEAPKPVAPPPPPKAGAKPPKSAAPVRPVHRAFFLTAGRPIVCEVATDVKDLKPWTALRKGEPFTVRGIHIKDGLLRSCQLRELSAVADEHHRGRELEVTGVIDVVLVPDGKDVLYPTVRLEGETFGQVTIECLFRKEDEAEVRKLKPGSPITIRGTCNGRHRRKSWYVRLDNCRVESSTAPVGKMVRLPAGALARAYESDLRTAPLPDWGKEERLPGTLAVEQLDGELKASRPALEAKYLYRIFTVTGRRLYRKGRELILESRNTDQPLRIVCRFDRHAVTFADEGGPNPVVRGFCTGLVAGAVRLDNAEMVLPPGSKDSGLWLTADFLPHKVGRIMTYDLAVFPMIGKRSPVVVRQKWFERAKGQIETMTTHKGYLSGRSMLDAPDPGAWFKEARTKPARLPGPVYEHRTSAGFIEVGRRMTNTKGKVVTVWAPVLKLGARTGESWTWAHEHDEYTWTVVGFGQRRGQPCVTVLEKVTSNVNDQQMLREVKHVYVKDLGQVERRETIQLTSKDKRIVAELRLIKAEQR
jgi:hypothetical protein